MKSIESNNFEVAKLLVESHADVSHKMMIN